MARRTFWRFVSIGGQPRAVYGRVIPNKDLDPISSVVFVRSGVDFIRAGMDEDDIREWIRQQNQLARKCKTSEEYEGLYKTLLTLTE